MYLFVMAFHQIKTPYAIFFPQALAPEESINLSNYQTAQACYQTDNIKYLAPFVYEYEHADATNNDTIPYATSPADELPRNFLGVLAFSSTFYVLCGGKE